MIQKTLRVPTDWNDITIGQYQNFCRLKEDASEDEIQRVMLSEFCGLEDVEIRNMSNQDKDKVVVKMLGIFNREPQRTQLVDYNGKRYGFHPNLEELTLGEFIDLEAYQDNVEHLHRVAHILYRPIVQSFGSRYRIESYEGSQESVDSMLDFPVGVVLSAHLFFWRLGIHLSNAILKYSEKEGDKMMRGVSSKSGGGHQRYTTYAKAMLRGLMKSPQFLCSAHFYGLLSKATKTNSKES